MTRVNPEAVERIASGINALGRSGMVAAHALRVLARRYHRKESSAVARFREAQSNACRSERFGPGWCE